MLRRFIGILILVITCLGCSSATDDISKPQESESQEECMDMDAVYKGTITNEYTGANAPMLLDILQEGCVVNGFIEIEEPLFTTGIIHGWIELDVLNFMALDRQRMIILGEELHFRAQMLPNKTLQGTFYSLDPQSNVNDEGVWEVVAYNPLAKLDR